MLKIYPEQISNLKKNATNFYRSKLIRWLEVNFIPKNTIDVEFEIVERIADHSLAVCEAAGIRGGADIATFAYRTMRHGIGHEERPSHQLTKSVLTDPSIPGASKMTQIRGRERSLTADKIESEVS